MTKRQAIAEVRAEADAIIEQLERVAKGWDKLHGFRADDTLCMWTVAERIEMGVANAFDLSRQYA